MNSREPKNRVLVIGLDGAVPEIIDKLIADGRMPNMAKFYERGAHGILKSTIPSISSLAWASFVTGNHPGKHGIFGFEGREKGSYQTRLMYATDMRTKPLWSILSEAERRIVMINVIMSYPPTRVNGVLVSGFLAPMETLHRGFTYPPELAEELVNDGYKVEPEVIIYQSRERYVDEVFSVMEHRAEATRKLLKKDDWDFFMVVFTSTDRLQHRFWQWMEPEHFDTDPKDVKKYGDVIYRCYERLDEIVGELLDYVGDDMNVILMSDHGFGYAKTNLNLHNWLVEEGLLHLRLTPWRRFVLSRYRGLTTWMGRLGLMGIVPFVRKYLPGGFRKMTGTFRINDAVDWSKTKVYSLEKALYINVKGRDPNGVVNPGQEYEDLRDSLIAKLQAIKDPATGEPIVEKVFKTEDVYWGAHADEGGDLLVRFKKGYRHWPRLAPGAPLITEEKVFCSYHHDHEDGFFAMAGPDVKQGATGTSSIVDLAPTIMHLMSVPIPNGLDGEVMLSMMDEASEAAQRPIAYQKPEDGRSRVRERIRTLRSKGRI
ncbi:MAG: alkaline phosphatase family protein [Chloroflexi bacterium]|nr:alkaline phosphatase family protein [Chloroflexota bacterium]